MTELETEIRKKVYEQYPKTEKEKTCWQERMRLEQLRNAYRLRLINEKREIEQKKISGITHQ